MYIRVNTEVVFVYLHLLFAHDVALIFLRVFLQ